MWSWASFSKPWNTWTLNNQWIAWQVVDMPCFTLGKHLQTIQRGKAGGKKCQDPSCAMKIDEACPKFGWIQFPLLFPLMDIWRSLRVDINFWSWRPVSLKKHFPGLVFLLWETNFHAERHLTESNPCTEKKTISIDVTPFQLHYHFLPLLIKHFIFLEHFEHRLPQIWCFISIFLTKLAITGGTPWGFEAWHSGRWKPPVGATWRRGKGEPWKNGSVGGFKYLCTFIVM